MMIRVEFRASKFPPYEGEEEQINLGLWGRRLAEYLVQKLAERGIETEEMVAEDWGWFIPVHSDGFQLALCCGHQYGENDEFLCFTDPSIPMVAAPQLERLIGVVQQILASDPDIREVGWSETR